MNTKIINIIGYVMLNIAYLMLESFVLTCRVPVLALLPLASHFYFLIYFKYSLIKIK